MTDLRTLALAALSAALISGCGSTDKDTAPKTTAPAATTTTAKQTAPAGEAKIVSLPFRVDVSLSDGARKRLAETNADLGISADYYGLPKNAGMAGLDPDLGVWLGGEMLTIDPGQRSVTFKGQVDAARVAREVNGDARVRVLVFPVRAFSGDAGISCTEFDEYLSIAVETGGTSHCTLTGE